MSAHEGTRTDDTISSDDARVEPRTDENHNVIDAPEEREPTEKPEVTDEHKATAKEMHRVYEQDLETVTMPGTGGTVAGTAVNDWLDDDGDPKFSDTSGGGEQRPETATT